MEHGISRSPGIRAHLCAVGKILLLAVAAAAAGLLAATVPGAGGLAGFALLLTFPTPGITRSGPRLLFVLNVLVSAAVGVTAHVMFEGRSEAVASTDMIGKVMALNILCMVACLVAFVVVLGACMSLRAMHVHYRGRAVAWMAVSAAAMLLGVPYADVVSLVAVLVLVAVPRGGIHPLSAVADAMSNPYADEAGAERVPTSRGWTATLVLLVTASIALSIGIIPDPVMPVRMILALLLVCGMSVVTAMALALLRGLASAYRSVLDGCRPFQA